MRESKIMQITVTVRQPPPSRLDGGDATALVTKILGAVDGVTTVSPPYVAGDAMTFSLLTSSDARADVCRAIVEGKLDLLKLDYARSELENTFIRIVGGPHGGN